MKTSSATWLSPEQFPQTGPPAEEVLTWNTEFPGAPDSQRLQDLLLVVTNGQVTDRHISDRARDHFYN